MWTCLRNPQVPWWNQDFHPPCKAKKMGHPSFTQGVSRCSGRLHGAGQTSLRTPLGSADGMCVPPMYLWLLLSASQAPLPFLPHIRHLLIRKKIRSWNRKVDYPSISESWARIECARTEDTLELNSSTCARVSAAPLPDWVILNESPHPSGAQFHHL